MRKIGTNGLSGLIPRCEFPQGGGDRDWIRMLARNTCARDAAFARDAWLMMGKEISSGVTPPASAQEAAATRAKNRLSGLN